MKSTLTAVAIAAVAAAMFLGAAYLHIAASAPAVQRAMNSLPDDPARAHRQPAEVTP